MKKLITTCTLVIIIITSTNAQINLPKVNTKTGELIAQNKSKGLKVDLSKVSSLQDLQGLNIPRAEISPDKLAEKSKKQWKINPWKMTDGPLVFKKVHGTYQNRQFVLQSRSIFSRSGPIPCSRVESILVAFPITIEFRAMANVEYRLILKHGGSYINNSEVLVSINGEMQSMRMNRQKEFNLIFLEEASKKMEIVFSGLVDADRQPLVESLIVSEILIDELQRN